MRGTPHPSFPVRDLDPGSSAWPADQLQGLERPPDRLRIRGELPLLDRAVAIVGTRRADEDGLAFARDLAASLARAGCPIVSGGAYGIDAAAHEGALDAEGATIAVLASGLADPYPRAHCRLFDRIAAEGGALLSELEDDAQPRRALFLHRNRLIAALAKAVVVVQAPFRSGAMSTAAWAKRLHRPLFVVPSAPWNPRGAGCLALLRSGATICTSARDVLSIPALGAGVPGEMQRNLTQMTDNTVQSAAEERRATARGASQGTDADKVLAALARAGRPQLPDEIARASGLPAARIQGTLALLVLDGRVEPRGGGRYVRSR